MLKRLLVVLAAGAAVLGLSTAPAMAQQASQRWFVPFHRDSGECCGGRYPPGGADIYNFGARPALVQVIRGAQATAAQTIPPGGSISVAQVQGQWVGSYIILSSEPVLVTSWIVRTTSLDINLEGRTSSSPPLPGSISMGGGNSHTTGNLLLWNYFVHQSNPTIAISCTDGDAMAFICSRPLPRPDPRAGTVGPLPGQADPGPRPTASPSAPPVVQRERDRVRNAPPR